MAAFGAVAEFAVSETPVGIDIAVPVATVTVSAAAPDVNPVIIAVPVSTVTVSTADPAVAAGAMVAPPTAVVAVTAEVPAILAGTVVAPPTAVVAVSAPAPAVLAGASIFPSEAVVSVDAALPNVVAGFAVVVDGYISQSNGGGVAEGAVAEFATAEGNLITRTLPGAVVVRVIAPVPQILAGKKIDVPAAVVNVVPFKPEIRARRRAVQTLAIAS